MRLSRTGIIAAVAGLAAVPSASAWGAAGHEIVATIAQIHLHPTVLPVLCDILGIEQDSPRCHLAPIATWADKIRMLPGFRWSAQLHYVGSHEDHPSDTCAFPGKGGWVGRAGVNVLGGVKNTTGILEDFVLSGFSGPDHLAEEALKFLVHFVGDMHQPLHLTGRERGGNGIKVRFDGRITNLHSVWDSTLIAKTLRTMPYNYTYPLDVPAVESALRDTIYDPYIRRVMWEGLLPGGAWAAEIPDWLLCPAAVPAGQTALGAEPGSEFDDGAVCPFHWAAQIHPLNCDIAWPKELEAPEYAQHVDSEAAEHHCGHDEGEHEAEEEALGGPRRPTPHYVELDTPQYAGAIAKRRIVEKSLAMGGIRLAAILNWLFVDPDALAARTLWVERLTA